MRWGQPSGHHLPSSNGMPNGDEDLEAISQAMNVSEKDQARRGEEVSQPAQVGKVCPRTSGLRFRVTRRTWQALWGF